MTNKQDEIKELVEIQHIIQDFTREDRDGQFYYIHDKDFMKLIQAIYSTGYRKLDKEVKNENI